MDVFRRILSTALLLACTSPIVGCSPEPEQPDPSALRAAFPEQAPEVLERGAGFSAVERGFSSNKVPDAGLWLRAEAELPSDGAELIRIRAGDFEARVREAGAEGRAALVERAVAYRRAGGTSYWMTTESGVEEWLHLQVKRDEAAASWEVLGGRLEQHGEQIAVLDEMGRARLWVSAPVAYASGGQSIKPELRVSGSTITLYVEADGEVLVDPAWTAAAPTSAIHAYGAAASLADGKVLVTGYSNAGSTTSAVAEIYDEQGAWTTAASMGSTRGLHRATLLSNGKVLVTGGTTGTNVLTSAELYDPATDTWSPAATMSVARASHTATLINGKVLVAGGFDTGGTIIQGTAELYDPQTDTWVPAGTMTTPRCYHTATILGNGKVLLAGGYGAGIYQSSAEIYDPQAGTWTATGSMSHARAHHEAVLLGNGKVLIAGGFNGSSSFSSAQLYDPSAGIWTTTGSMASPRFWFTSTLLGNGHVLVTGGLGGDGGGSELYSPITDKWAGAGTFTIGRAHHTATLLTNGDVMITGGASGTSVRIYSQLALGEACAAPGECSSGFCVAGVCCDMPCSGACKTCLAAQGAPQNGTCAPKTDGAACSDGNACTQSDTCQAGACTGANLKTCAPSGPCRDAGTCDPTTGVCSDPPKADGDPCTDGDLCTQDDTCQGGACQPGAPLSCAAQDQCHDAGTCDPMTGVCSNPNKMDGAGCDDGNPCTLASACQAGACIATISVPCSSDWCNDGVCDPADGQCKLVPKSDGTACSDGDACTLIDVCQSGLCAGTAPVVCSPIGQCHIAGTCDSVTGLCSNPPAPYGTPCTAGACALNSKCDGSGACFSVSPVTCITQNPCEDPGSCHPVTGCPDPTPKPMGAPCDDGNACTTNDVCNGSSACQPGSPKVCTAQSQCHDPGTCDPQTGSCSNPIKAVGYPCDDGNSCTEKDACDAQGACQAGPVKACQGPNPCMDYGACDAQTGCPQPVPKAESTPCTDPSNLCVGAGICQNGACVGAEPKACPSDACNDGYCDPASGCKTKAKSDGTPCDDGSKCTAGDACTSGVCKGNSSCEPLGVCDDATCDPATGFCSHTPKQGCAPSDGGAGDAGPPPTVPAEVTLCSSDDQCATGHCSDGVCCDEACDQTCYSCILPGSIGECTASPHGVDYRDDCYPGRDCFMTCDGAGSCTSAGSTTQCAPPECGDESHLLEAAVCSMGGADCALESRVAQSCAPYRCIDALRACGTKCDSIAQCAPGFVCHPDNVCRAPPGEPLEVESGCSFGRGRAGSCSALFIVAAAALAALRHRRRRAAVPLVAMVGLLAGCGTDGENPDPNALRAAFPEQAREVLERGDGFSIDQHGFSWEPREESRAWVRVEAVFPRDGADPIRLRVRDFEARVREIGAAGAGTAIDRAVAYRRAGGTSYWTASPSGVEEWLHLKEARGDVAAAWEIEGGQLEQHGEHVAVIDGAGAARLWVSAPVAYAARGGARRVITKLRSRGTRLELSVDAEGEEVLVDPLWTPVAPMATARITHTAALLGNGNVLIAGGFNQSILDSAELYNPITNTWSAAPSMLAPRSDTAFTLLSDGRLFVPSGSNTAASDIYDPIVNTWSAAAAIPDARAVHTVTLLGNGKVLVVGGVGSGFARPARLYDPIADTWSAIIPMATVRHSHAAARLKNGKVVVMGGMGPAVLASAELYDPVTNAWSSAGTMAFGRARTPATLLPNGKVLVAGGLSVSSIIRSDAELYDPSTNTWSPAGTMATARDRHTATLLPSGKVLVTGGSPDTSNDSLSSAELYDPDTNSWSPAGAMSVGRELHMATLLPDGGVLITAGRDFATLHESCDLYKPLALGAACARANDCASGLCAGGVCCDSPCDGACDTCLASEGASQDGTCGSKTNGSSCSDGNGCTQTDTCQAGVCAGGTPKTCTPLDDCHDAGICDPVTGICTDPVAANGVPCTDGDLCTQNDTCQGGVCQSGTAITCAAADQCHDVGACDPQTGVCDNPHKASGAPCDDGNVCTQSDACQSGICVGSDPVVCSTANQCLEPGICDPAAGCPAPAQKPQGTPCDDGNACTQYDVCQGGSCAAGSAVTCAALDQCHVAGACDPQTGLCSNPNKPNGTSCTDGNGCTQGDACQGGVCTGTSKICPPPLACQDAGTCIAPSGICAYANKPSGASCDDNNACTQDGVCDASGACSPGAPIACIALDACHDPGTCDPLTGACDNPQRPAGALCDDGDQCTEKETCDAQGTCNGIPVECASPGPCQVAGACDAQTGCPSPVDKADGAPCAAPADPCGNAGVCQGGTCVLMGPKVCPSGPCDDGYCDPQSGQCQTKPKPDGGACSDGDKCTTNDACAAGTCQGVAIPCPAPDACHEPGTCDPDTGQCINNEIPNCSLSNAGTPGEGPPPTVPTAAVLCSSSDECPTGQPHCVDGVCCNSACAEVCHSCVQAGHIGECFPSKAGVDLRHDCAPPYTCEFTCDGQGQCIKAQSLASNVDMQCAPDECAEDGIHVLGLVYCSDEGAGLDCPVDGRATYTCAPYRCVKALGACGVECDTVRDCAPPFVCDTSRRCVPPPDVASGSDSCAFAILPSGVGSNAGPLGLALLALLTAARRGRCRRVHFD